MFNAEWLEPDTLQLIESDNLIQQLTNLVTRWRNEALEHDESGPTAARRCANELEAVIRKEKNDQ